ncbi:MAG: hypothetical protein IJ365_00145 [Clostridia bacterium]|nr:hypothetical protein [Clostridia bacterium]
MNILTDKLPATISVCGVEYPINTDFRVWIKFELIFQNYTSKEDACYEAIKLCFKRTSSEHFKLPPTPIDTMKALFEFYIHHDDQEISDSAENKQTAERVYSFEHDADKIYAAFREQYSIDLSATDMHWWTFRAYFDNLSEDTRFMQIVKYRCTDLSKIKDKETRRFYAEMKQLFALPDSRTADEKEKAFAASFAGLF